MTTQTLAKIRTVLIALCLAALSGRKHCLFWIGVSFRLVFLAFVGWFAQQMAFRWRLIAAAPQALSTDDLSSRTDRFITEVVFQSKVIGARPWVGVAHLGVYYGFVAFGLYTAIEAINGLGLIDLRHNTFFHVYRLLLVPFALSVLTGIVALLQPIRHLLARFAVVSLMVVAFGLMLIGKADIVVVDRTRAAVVNATAPVLDALFAKKEPKTGTDGTMSWTVDILNPVSGDDFVLMLKELVLPNGQRRPYSVWLAGVYPRALDGLCKLLSLDMRVIDPAWIGMKLRKLLSYDEPLGDFMARVPGDDRQQNFPSTVAYMARLIIHRYAMLGILDERGFPVNEMGVLEMPEEDTRGTDYTLKPVHGKPCKACGNAAVIKKDGCEFCTACGEIGACG